MKKIILSMALAVALAGSGSIQAQDKTDGSTGATQQKECCQTDGNTKGEKPGKNKKGPGKKAYNAFEGVQLSPDQQQKLQVLREGLGPVQLTPEQQAKIKENPNLTKEEKKQLKAEKKAAKLERKKKYLAGVKEILTPEQYVIFLENCYVYNPQGPGKGKWMKDGKKNGPNDKKGKHDKKQLKVKKANT